MKILYYYFNNETIMQNWQFFHIIDDLKKNNIEIVVFNPLFFDSIEVSNAKLIEHLNNNHYDLFMTPHNHELLFISTIKKIMIKKLLICFDNIIVPFKHRKIAKFFDLVWITSKDNYNFFRKISKKVIFLPYAANPVMAKKTTSKFIPKVVFVGTPYGSRANLINFLLSNKIPVVIFSSELLKSKCNSNKEIKKNNIIVKKNIIEMFQFLTFKNGRKIIFSKLIQVFYNSKLNKINTNNQYLEMFESVPTDKISDIYSKYALCLSSTDARNTGVLRSPVKIVNLRSFEIPMSGGLQICSYSDELSGYYVENKEILFYRSRSDLIKKIKFYLDLKNKNITIKMKNYAKTKSVNSHTWYLRFKIIFQELDISI